MLSLLHFIDPALLHRYFPVSNTFIPTSFNTFAYNVYTCVILNNTQSMLPQAIAISITTKACTHIYSTLRAHPECGKDDPLNFLSVSGSQHITQHSCHRIPAHHTHTHYYYHDLYLSVTPNIVFNSQERPV